MAIIVDKDGNVVTVENEPDEARELFKNLPEGGVQDVKINGTSIVDENGDADIPIATTQKAGAILVGPDESGIEKDSGNFLKVLGSTIAGTKAGIEIRRPVTPSIQHGAAFYGLAKAAGDTTQSQSDNAVGNYTAKAKSKILAMLGAEPEEYELIADITTDASLTELEINQDTAQNSFKLKKMIVIGDIKQPTTGNADVFYTSYKVRINGESADDYIGSVSMNYASGSSEMFFKCQANAHKNAPIEIQTLLTNNLSNPTSARNMVKTNIVDYITAFRITRSSSTSTSIPVGSTFKMYGIRYSE